MHCKTVSAAGSNPAPTSRGRMREACGCLSYTKRDGQDVTFTCLEDKPAVDIAVIVEAYV